MPVWFSILAMDNSRDVNTADFHNITIYIENATFFYIYKSNTKVQPSKAELFQGVTLAAPGKFLPVQVTCLLLKI